MFVVLRRDVPIVVVVHYGVVSSCATLLSSLRTFAFIPSIRYAFVIKKNNCSQFDALEIEMSGKDWKRY